MTYLFTVEDQFQITGRGCILVPGVPDDPTLPVVRINDRIVLRRPDGVELSTHIAAFEMINWRKGARKISTPILLPRGLAKDDVPNGTEVFLAQLE